LNAQNDVHPCGAHDLVKAALLSGEPDAYLQSVAEEDAALEAFTAQWAAANSGAERVLHTIPVVFHIIHNNGPENISDAQVIDAVRVLNDDFNKLNIDWPNVRPDFLPLVADVDVEFRLAQRDPQGNCTSGITRTVSPLTNDGSQTMKNLIQWPRNKYLNVWVAASADGAAGYTYRPNAVANQPTWDGIVLLHNYTGAIGTSSPNRSRTLTHEVGHWINLAHTWGNSNTPALPENCNGDDNVSDTPNTIGWTNCTLAGTSCGSLDNVENYMEYSYCSKMFTEGQKTRMLAALNSSTAQRNQLWTANNLSATGVNQALALCQAQFGANKSLVCAGTPVTFTDMSFHNVTSRTWSFPGGTPDTSTEANPVVTYSQPGVYSASLTVSDGNATLSASQNAIITVMANPGALPPVVEGFESVAALNGPEWFAPPVAGANAFGITSTASFSGTRSSRVLNTTAMDGISVELLSRTFDMTNAEDITISFRWAYAKRTSTSDDVLSLYISNDCGNNWALRKIMRGTTTLPTGPVTTGSFVPNGAAQWGYTEVSNISATSHISDFRFKFVFESDGGNNLYLDDINIAALPVGIAEAAASPINSMRLVPNPARDEARLTAFLRSSGKANVDLLDATGRLVMSRDLGTLPAGETTLTLRFADLDRGAYVVRLRLDEASTSTRLMLE
jgi:PKD repeat protein